jgi:hypothetical protein
MSSKSVAARSARESARKRIGKFSINSIYKKVPAAGYPECAGVQETCPNQIEDLKNPPEKCRKCPHFMDSRHYEKHFNGDRLKQFHELFASLRKGAEENLPGESMREPQEESAGAAE